MGQYDSSIALAKSLITKYGQIIAIRRTTQAAAPDATMPWKRGEPTVADTSALGVFLEYNRREIDGEKIKQGDQKVFVPAADLAIVPLSDDVIVRGSEVWSIIDIKELNPNGERIMYEIQVRQ